MKQIVGFILLLFLILSVVTAYNHTEKESSSIDNSMTIADSTSSDVAFNTMMDVITHKRCVNCHPSDNFPKQGEDSHKHLFDVQRGIEGQGVAAVQCNTCHQKENNDYSGVPGAPHWGLAPKSMAWKGLSRIEIAKAMIDKSKNGNRSLKEIEKHLTEDKLVLWAFEPGVNSEGIAREKPPVSKGAYIKAVKEWIKSGAAIPQQ